VTRSREEARARIRECLAATPGLTAGQVGAAIGLRSNAMRTLKAMLYDAEVIAVPQWREQMGRDVSTWLLAPPGTVPPPRPAPDPDALGRRREREAAAQRARRAAGRPDPGRVPDLSAGACRSADPDLFFRRDGEARAGWHRRQAAAKAICGGCGVWRRCLLYALDSGQGYGVWGGTDEDDRRAIMRRQAQRRAS
jgi:WhiB family transcriptional regulator, redox-sensing transcriptional regulator